MLSKTRKVVWYPVTLTQKELLDRCIHPQSKDDPRNSWVISSATLVRPRVDMRRLSRAYQKLQERHDSLRIQFELVKNTWRAIIGPVPDAPIKQIDLGDVDNETFRRCVIDTATAPMPLINHSQSEIILMKCGARGDVVIWRVSDTITDGYGSIVLTEDLLKFLFGMPVHGRAVSHAEFIGQFENAPRTVPTSSGHFGKRCITIRPRRRASVAKPKVCHPMYGIVVLN